MLDNQSMGPNATINRWIEEIRKYHFTLVHVKGIIHGPDGLLRITPGGWQPPRPPLDPESYEEFKHKIDTQGGYLAEIATSIQDFEDNVQEEADEERQALSVFQKSLILEPDEDFKTKNPYMEKHQSEAGNTLDQLIPWIKDWHNASQSEKLSIKDEMTEKDFVKFMRKMENFFLNDEGQLYHRRREFQDQPQLVVDREDRMGMLYQAHDCLGHKGVFATQGILEKRFWWPDINKDITPSRREGLRNHRSTEEEQILLTIQSAELNYELSDLFVPVPDDEAAHNHPSLLQPLSEEERLLLLSDSEDNGLHSPNLEDNGLRQDPSNVEGNRSPVQPSPSTTSPPSPRNQQHRNPSPIQPIVMATPTPLPSRNERKAPKWDSQYEEQLPTFFDEFETVAREAAIDSNDEKMKKEALRYVDAKTMRFWRSLDTFEDDTKTWKDFKKEVLSNYPVTKFAKTGVSNSQELAEYHREFSTVAKSLTKHGILSGVQVAGYYVQVFPDTVRAQLNMRLQFQHTAKKKGEAYSLAELKEAVDFLLSDANTSLIVGNFNIGDHSRIVAIDADDGEDGRGKSGKSSKPAKATPSTSDRTDTCYWDGCAALRFSDCPDFAEWIAKGRVERNAEGKVVLKGGNRLPNESRYKGGLIKTRFERYFEDNPSAKSWILETPSQTPAPSPQLAGVAISTHSKYSLKGYQGPEMLSKVASFLTNDAQDLEDEDEQILRRLIFKMETRKSAKNRTSGEDTEADNRAPSGSEPEPSKSIPPAPAGPAKPPKPVIGKLPQNYVPPAERSLGAPPKDDSRNYRFRAPIETEAAVERAIQAGLSSMVSIRQDDLLAIAPEYRKKVKDSVTGRRVGFDGKLLEEANQTYLVEPVLPFDTEVEIPVWSRSTVDSAKARAKFVPDATKDPVSVFFQDFGDSEEGDGFYVAKDSLSIRGINATIGERSVHCVTDSGCSIVAMSDTACNAFGIAFDPGRTIPLQSANGETDWTLGVAKDVPFRFGEVLAFLQVHIVPSPAYDVLLGRPFRSSYPSPHPEFPLWRPTLHSDRPKQSQDRDYTNDPSRASAIPQGGR
ncbi:hypothetical protein BT96DRAFT_1003596 [Gymnopus androsaceus JB14]|uniref:Integrase zinc-binding domain-containing protein n=1 Tax=Gymnopus androsaceus JB14 TaxID=1447944 RepID=A0A6A4GUD8_9AGAR|nr:hypothetical protein BT96DRAFT_1003596 [Gymnopus androsaceus JB14]